MSKEIGGFFELELNNTQEYHNDAIKLNSARYCLQYILKAKKYNKIYIPYYICDSVLEPIKKENLQYEYYSINDKFEPIFNKNIGEDECFLYVNYFGVNSENVKKVRVNLRNVIIDNTQAFFEMPLFETDTIYSARKFFGVSDGGYLYTDKIISCELEQDISYNRCEYLLKRREISANESYELFIKNEEALINCKMKKMSMLTQSILSSINYESTKTIRNNNFLRLHEKLNKYNEMEIYVNDLNGPMVYPFLISYDWLKAELIKNKVYVATYWKEVVEKVSENDFEYILSKNLIPLPVDQRYKLEDMDFVFEMIMKFLNQRI